MTHKQPGITGIFLDPPYGGAQVNRAAVYAHDDITISAAVREWCLEHIAYDEYSGPRYRHPRLRIALCGYEEEHAQHMPSDWTCYAWNANRGYSAQRQNGKNDNYTRERIWFSPNCINSKRIKQLELFK